MENISTQRSLTGLLGLPMAVHLFAAQARTDIFALHGDGLVQDSHLFPFRYPEYSIINFR